MDHHHADDEDITQLRNRSAHHLSYPNFVISHDTPVGTSSPSPTLRARSMYHNSSDHQRRISDGDLILSEDMTTRDRQEAINQNHPFGLRLWKPALYKKPRTIESISYQSVHETPSSASRQSSWFSDWHLYSGNFAWTLLFGWWMAAVFLCVSIAILLPTLAMNKSGRRYSWLMFSMALYIFWPFGLYIERVHSPYNDNISSPAVETQPLLSTRTEGSRDRDLAHSLFYQFFYYIIIAPMLLIVSGLCWFLIVSIPVAKLNFVLLGYLNKDPLSLRVSSPILSAIQRQQQQQDNVFSGEILVCVYKAVGLQYLKYTYDGINIVFINLLPAVLFALLDGYFIGPALGHEGVGHPMVVFVLCILSVMPLAYYIGMAVASISSQSSFGFGAVVNASFGSIVEIILYAIAITEGKGRLVEGAIIGSFLGTLLLLPGLSMIAGGVGRFKEQRFNVKSASVSTVLLIMALIGAFTPTLFYSVYGSYELQCQQCLDTSNAFPGHKCTGCSYQLPQNPGTDPFYINNVRPLMYLCAAVLPSAYLIGLLFTLRTHVKQIYHSDSKHRESSLLNNRSTVVSETPAAVNATTASAEHKQQHECSGGGHEAPEWSKWKSTVILLISTVLFALLAELLVDSVDEVISSSGVDPKFLGLTIFAIVPSFTEFLNALMFAKNGNVALSLEIGSAYLIQVALIQIPCLVAFSAVWTRLNKVPDTLEKSFTLIFPRWDCYTVFFGVFLLSYTYIEGKSNYFKGSILTLSYLVLLMSFYYSPPQ